MTTQRTQRRRERGPRLSSLLVALALLPLVGVGSFGVERFQDATSTKETADAIVDALDQVTALDELQLALTEERNFTAVVRGTELLGVTTEYVAQLTGVDLGGESDAARARVDRALDTPEAAMYLDEVSGIRSIPFAPGDGVEERYTDLERRVADRADDVRFDLEASAASLSDGSAVVDAVALSEAATAARFGWSRKQWAYFATAFNSGPTARDAAIELAGAQGRVEDALDVIVQRAPAGSELSGIADALRSSEAVGRFEIAVDDALDVLFDPSVAPPTAPPDPLATLRASAEIFEVGFVASGEFETLATAASRLVAETNLDVREQASSSFTSSMVRLVVVAVLSVAVAVALARYVGRPMRLLTADAKRLGEGGSIGAHESGPREVRRIGTALRSAAHELAHLERLEHQATHDDLTGIPTRRPVREHLDRAIGRARRSDGGGAVLFIDVDHFKDVNDTYGHAVGDSVLVEVAERLRSALRFGDELGRFGGDEFVVIAEPAADEDEAMRLARRLVEVVSAPIDVSWTTDGSVSSVVVTVSVGVTRFGPWAEAGVDVLRRADDAVYRAKAEGRDRAVFVGYGSPPTSDQVDQDPVATGGH